jgi:hypothetical protein
MIEPIEETKKCPFCAETIKAEAVVCRFCGRDLIAKTPEPVKAKNRPTWVVFAILILFILCVAVFIFGPKLAGAPAIVPNLPTAAQSCRGIKVSGHGDSIVTLKPPCGGAMSISYKGESNFVVRAHPAKRLAVNAIGNYEGVVMIPDNTETLEINAEGNWAIAGQ